MVVNPVDGAMYFTIGGRKTKSGLYRVTSTEVPKKERPLEINFGAGPAEEARATRLALEKEHRRNSGPVAVAAAWKELDNADRYTRFAARVVLEHNDTQMWAEKALKEKDADKAIPALLALTRVSAPCPEHTPEKKVKGDPALRAKIVDALMRIDFAKLNEQQKLDLLRTYQVFYNRFGTPPRPAPADGAKEWEWVNKNLGKHLPDQSRFVNAELVQVLVAIDAVNAEKVVKLLRESPTQEEQIEYARSLRMLKSGWNRPSRGKNTSSGSLRPRGTRAAAASASS